MGLPWLPVAWREQRVETKIRLDGIDLPAADVAKRTGQTLRFPLNDERATLDAPSSTARCIRTPCIIRWTSPGCVLMPMLAA